MIRARGGVVRVRVRVRDRVRVGVTVAAGNSQKHGITTFRPGFAILVNLPNCSISATVPVFTVTQGMIPHDIGGGWGCPGEVSGFLVARSLRRAMTIRRRPAAGGTRRTLLQKRASGT